MPEVPIKSLHKKCLRPLNHSIILFAEPSALVTSSFCSQSSRCLCGCFYNTFFEVGTWSQELYFTISMTHHKLCFTYYYYLPTSVSHPFSNNLVVRRDVVGTCSGLNFHLRFWFWVWVPTSNMKKMNTQVLDRGIVISFALKKRKRKCSYKSCQQLQQTSSSMLETICAPFITSTNMDLLLQNILNQNNFFQDCHMNN